MLENLVCHFAEVRGSKPPWLEVQVLVTKPDWDAKRWNPLEGEEGKEEDVV